MSKVPATSNMTVRNLLIVSSLLAVVLGGATGYAVGVFSRPSPSPQNREFFLFAFDQNFASGQVATGLTSDYVYQLTVITVNKGDTVTIHFYNPTDKPHTFTLAAPYTSDVTVANATSTTISKQDIVFTASTAGMFVYHCKFHTPQMVGTLIVQS